MKKQIETIYLAGTIDVNNPEEALEKFNSIQIKLEELGLIVFSPTRGKTIREINTSKGDQSIYEPNEIVHRDLNDIKKADIIIAFMDVPSIGTAMEIMYARYVMDIPAIVVTRSPRVFYHPWIIALASKRLRTLDQALNYLKNWWL